MKIITKSSMFGNSMLAAVLLNTVVMAMERYDLTEEERNTLDMLNSVFTNTFICELACQLLAIGFKKYVSEAMNILDGSVVLLSLVEYAMAAVSGGGGSLSAFKTIRILRTLRVLRVARLLRALESMQVIISVLQKSFSSFMYIAMLLGICCFIFALLGKTLFGG
jgi:voltage-gated sodium channel